MDPLVPCMRLQHLRQRGQHPDFSRYLQTARVGGSVMGHRAGHVAELETLACGLPRSTARVSAHFFGHHKPSGLMSSGLAEVELFPEDY